MASKNPRMNLYGTPAAGRSGYRAIKGDYVGSDSEYLRAPDLRRSAAMPRWRQMKLALRIFGLMVAARVAIYMGWIQLPGDFPGAGAVQAQKRGDVQKSLDDLDRVGQMVR